MADVKFSEVKYFYQKWSQQTNESIDDILEEHTSQTVGLYWTDQSSGPFVKSWCRYKFTAPGDGSKISFQAFKGDTSSISTIANGDGYSTANFQTRIDNGTIKFYCSISDNEGDDFPPIDYSAEMPLIEGMNISNTARIYSTSKVEIEYNFKANQEYYLWVYSTHDDGRVNAGYLTMPSLQYFNYTLSIDGTAIDDKTTIKSYKYYKPYVYTGGTFKKSKSIICADGESFLKHQPIIMLPMFDTKLISAKFPNRAGQIYYDSEDFDFSLYIKRNFGQEQKVGIGITISNHNGAKVSKVGYKVIPLTNYEKLPITELFQDELAYFKQYGLFTISIQIKFKEETLFTISYPFCRLRAAAPVARIGMNLHISNNTTVGQNLIDLASNTGASLWRTTLPWASVETSNGFSMPSIVNLAINYANDKNIKPLIILGYGNDALYGAPDPTSEAWLTAYGNYCKYVAEQLKGRVGYYEIWNEWNHSTMSKVPPEFQGGKYYAMVAKKAYESIREVDSDTPIVYGVTAGAPEAWINDVLEELGDLNNSMSAFSFHTYSIVDNKFTSPNNYQYEQYFNIIRKALDKYVPTMPIWLTETGWPTHTGNFGGPSGVTEREAAIYAVQIFIWTLANQSTYNVQHISWYDLMNDGSDTAYAQHNFGLVRNYEDEVPYAPKAAYVAFNTLSYLLNRMVTSLLLSSKTTDKLNIYEGFDNRGKRIEAAWTNNGQVSYSIPGGSVVMDIYGATSNYINATNITIGETPIYILYN